MLGSELPSAASFATVRFGVGNIRWIYPSECPTAVVTIYPCSGFYFLVLAIAFPCYEIARFSRSPRNNWALRQEKPREAQKTRLLPCIFPVFREIGCRLASSKLPVQPALLIQCRNVDPVPRFGCQPLARPFLSARCEKRMSWRTGSNGFRLSRWAFLPALGA